MKYRKKILIVLKKIKISKEYYDKVIDWAFLGQAVFMGGGNGGDTFPLTIQIVITFTPLEVVLWKMFL